MTLLWNFYQWGMDIMGLFLLALGQLEFLIIGVGYFTKWIEVEVVAKITIERVRCFYWQKNLCKYGLTGFIASDNGTLFSSAIVTDFCKDLGVQTKFVFIVHPQTNGKE